jgi:hypothetical protein
MAPPAPASFRKLRLLQFLAPMPPFFDKIAFLLIIVFPHSVCCRLSGFLLSGNLYPTTRDETGFAIRQGR